MKTEKLGNLIGLTKGKKHQETDDINASRYLQIEDVNGADNLKFTDEKGVQVKSDDIILVWDGANAGKVGIGLTGIIGSTLSRMTIDAKIIFPKYLFWFLQSKIDYIKSQRTGATIPHVSQSSIRNLPIPLLPLPAQERIATILDQADSIRRTNRQILEKYNELAQSVFFEMFGDPILNPKGWEYIELGKLSRIITKGESPKWQGFGYLHEGVRFITSENVRLGSLNVLKDKFIAEKFHKKIERSQLKKNDLLVNLVGASIGRGALVPSEILPANINQAVAKIELHCNIVNAKFILHQIITPQIQAQLIGNKVEGARANISLKNVRELVLINPPLTLQKKFVEIITNIEKQKALSQKSLEKSEDLFQSLLQRAFKGEL